MKIIDAHSHTDFRSANDYELMALAGVSTVVSPCTFSGLRKTSKEVYFAYIDRLLNFETWRARQNGVDLFIGVGVDCEDFEDIDLALSVLDDIPKRYFGHPKVCCFGEIGMDKCTVEEQKLFQKHLSIVAKYNIPAIIHTPQEDKEGRIGLIIEMIDRAAVDLKLNKDNLLLDELSVGVLSQVFSSGFPFYGIPVSPLLSAPFVIHHKASGCEVLEAIRKYGGDKIILSSALAWGYGDPLALPKIYLYLKTNGIEKAVLEKIFYDNAKGFFGRWGKIV